MDKLIPAMREEIEQRLDTLGKMNRRTATTRRVIRRFSRRSSHCSLKGHCDGREVKEAATELLFVATSTERKAV
jgi:hypothetical protein